MDRNRKTHLKGKRRENRNVKKRGRQDTDESDMKCLGKVKKKQEWKVDMRWETGMDWVGVSEKKREKGWENRVREKVNANRDFIPPQCSDEVRHRGLEP